MVVKATFMGSAIGMMGGAFIGAVLDGMSFITISHISGEMLTVVLSLIGGAGTGVAAGGSTLASVYIASHHADRHTDGEAYETSLSTVTLPEHHSIN